MSDINVIIGLNNQVHELRDKLKESQELAENRATEIEQLKIKINELEGQKNGNND